MQTAVCRLCRLGVVCLNVYSWCDVGFLSYDCCVKLVVRLIFQRYGRMRRVLSEISFGQAGLEEVNAKDSTNSLSVI